MKSLLDRNIKYSFIIILVCSLAFSSMAQETIEGVIKDKTNGDPLIGATVLVKGTGSGTVTDIDGKFSFETSESLPVTLVINFIGYETKEIIMEANESLKIQLEPAGLQLETVSVKGRRLSEERQKSALTMESLDPIAIKETPAASFYEGLGNLTGVDLTTASLGFTVINTRGFNSTSPVRSLQLIDGVDNQSPGLNFSLGNFLGSPELDILKVDLIQGASSSFYGPNAFNGVISMTTKDPFLHKGLGAMIKVGERNLVETAIRWADDIKNKNGDPVFAYKMNFSYLRADDWEAENYDPIDESRVDKDNPGRFDAVNIYGDEYFRNFDESNTPLFRDVAGLGTYYREGYREIDLVDYNTENIKANIVGSFRLNPEKGMESTHLTLASSLGNGTTVYQGDNRFRLENILFFQNRIELHKKDKFFLRAYATNEDAGDSYDPYATALRMQRAAASNDDWGSRYVNFWQANIFPRMRENGYPPLEVTIDPQTGEVITDFDNDAANQWLQMNQDSLHHYHNLARQVANSDGGFYAPGTDSFNTVFNRLIRAKNNPEERGTRFFDRSALYHVHGEYMWDIAFFDEFRTGANARLYRPNSDGTIFSDTSGRQISNFEYGAYFGGTKNFFDDKLIASASLRMDKNQNFDFLFTPAASLVYSPAKDNFLRFSYSSAIRNPTLSDQYLLLNVGPAILSGNLEGATDLITLESFSSFVNTLSVDSLEFFDIDPIRPERVQTFELGYRTIISEDLYVDAGYYFSIYRDFIGFNVGIDADLTGGIARDVVAYRYAANSTEQVTTQGFNIGLKYFFNKFSVTGNYSWNKLNAFEEDPIIPAFNTPEHKFNVGLGARNLEFILFGLPIRNISFNVNYKWVEGFLFEGSPQFTGFVPTYDLVDAQISWRAKKINTTFKLGGTNLLNQRQIQTFGGPEIGRLVYFSATYDWKKE